MNLQKISIEKKQQSPSASNNRSKVVFLPLDERPCNFKFPKKLYSGTSIEIVQPQVLGNKKTPADVNEIERFLLESCRDADYAVLAIDTLFYGGLIPSRLHTKEQEEISGRLELLSKLKEINPKLKIYAFQCIMRCPKYSSADEEPDYYDICGAEIHKMGILTHKKQLGLECEYDYDELKEKITEKNLEDYLNRRAFNIKQNLHTLDLVSKGVIDFLIIPQDDSAPYGYTAMDQKVVRERLQELHLGHKVYIYPGADEIGLTLMSRVVNDINKKTPRVFVKYASVNGQGVIPLFEDRSLGETVKYHLMAAGCVQVHSDENPDFVLAITAPPSDMLDILEPWDHRVDALSYSAERNMPEFIYSIEMYLKNNIPVTIADNAYTNGGELELLTSLNDLNLLFDLSGYAGWNTSSNTIGTSIAQAVRSLYWEKNNDFKSFLILRYLEDVGYCSQVREKVTNDYLPDLGLGYYSLGEKQGEVVKIIERCLNEFAQDYLGSIKEQIHIKSVSMPWNRMFEIDIEL